MTRMAYGGSIPILRSPHSSNILWSVRNMVLSYHTPSIYKH